jgi:heme exporter protein CcmD
MIPDMGPHAAFIWSAYAIAAIALAALTAWLILDGQRHARRLAAFEARRANQR